MHGVYPADPPQMSVAKRAETWFIEPEGLTDSTQDVGEM